MTDEHQEQDEADRPPQETVSFTFDRMTVARFRETFPNARWSDRLQAWTVAGKTARKRIDRWLATEAGRKPYKVQRENRKLCNGSHLGGLSESHRSGYWKLGL